MPAAVRRAALVALTAWSLAAALPPGAPQAPAAAEAHHYCPAGARAAMARVQLWRDAKCAGGSMIVGTTGDPDRADFRSFRNDADDRSYNVDNTRSSLSIKPGSCVRVFDGVGYGGEASNLLCTPPSAEDWGLFAFNDRASSMRVCAIDRQGDCGAGAAAPPPTGTTNPPPGGSGDPPGGSAPPPAPAPAPPPADDPATPVPPPAPAPACTGRTVQLGPFTATASCFRRDGAAYVATGQVRVGGVDITATGANAEVRIEPAALAVSTRGSTQVRVGAMVLYRREITWRLGERLTFAVERNVRLRGLPVTGSATLTADARARTVSIGLNLQLPSVLGGVTGATTIQAGSDGVVVNDITVTAGSARVGRFEVRGLSLAYSRAAAGAYHFDGEATLVLPSPMAPTVMARLGFGIGDDYFRAGGEVARINKPLAYGVYLQRIRFDIQVSPVRLSGGMGVSAGPRILGREAVSVDGDFVYENGDPDRYAISGNARIVDVEVASGSVSYQTNGRFDMSARVNFTKFDVGFEGDVVGWVDGASAFNFQGTGRVKAGPFSQGGEGVISSWGIAACRNGWGPDVGFGYGWDGTRRIFANSCNVGPWVVQRGSRSASSAQALATFRSFGVGRNQPVAVFSVVGSVVPPKAVLTDPDGTAIAVTPDDPAGGIDDGKVLLYQNREDRTTYIAVDAPKPGLYRLSLRTGSNPASQFRAAQALPAPAIRGRVEGEGRRRVLRYRFTKQRGRSVAFYEQGRDTRRRLRLTGSPRGTVRFTVPDGRPGRRDIVAVVRQDGITQSAGVVARYTAPPPRRPLRPRFAGVARRNGTFVVRWGGARRAASYEVRVYLSDGRRLLYLPGRTTRRITVPGARTRMRASVTVRGLSATNRRGPRARART